MFNERVRPAWRNHSRHSVFGIIINGGQQPRFWPSTCGCGQYCSKCRSHFSLQDTQVEKAPEGSKGILGTGCVLKTRSLSAKFCPHDGTKLGRCPY